MILCGLEYGARGMVGLKCKKLFENLKTEIEDLPKVKKGAARDLMKYICKYAATFLFTSSCSLKSIGRGSSIGRACGSYTDNLKVAGSTPAFGSCFFPFLFASTRMHTSSGCALN